MAELAVAHYLAGERGGATRLAAQLAHDPLLALVDVYALTDERSALTVFATMAVGCQRTDAPPQQEALELLDVCVRECHGD